MTTVRSRALETTIACGVAVAFAVVVQAAEAPKLDRKSIEEDVRYLASGELAGRGNGTEGLRLAASYVAEQFKELGLQPAGEAGSYFQSFRVMVGKDIGRHTRITLRYGETAQQLDYPSDFEPMTFSSAGELSAPLVFAGYGVTAPEHDYDDYDGVDVEGKAVMVLRYVPGHALERGPFEKEGWHATFVRKAENAVSHGAAAVIIVNGPLHHRGDRLIRFGVPVGAESMDVPVVHLRRTYAERLLRDRGLSLEELQRSIDERLAPRSFELEGGSIELSIDVRRTIVEVANVLGYLPPTSSASSEHIIVGAHYDHLGLGQKGSRERRSTGQIHNGADDNASGVAGVLELARIFSEVDDRPRGILFAAFAGEELGLQGSYHYTTNATHRLEDAVAMLNLDMIGRLRHSRLFVGGIELLPELVDTVERLSSEEGLTFSTGFSGEAASDHASFIRAGVPALFLFTGLHGDYHKPSDDPQFVNFDGMERVLNFGYDIAEHLLRSHDRPELRVARSGRGLVTRRASRAAAYFGVGVDTSFEGDGVRFSYVADNGPAARAGLRAGDVLLALDGRTVRSGERATALIKQKRPGETIHARVRRNDRVFEVKIRLSRWP